MFNNLKIYTIIWVIGILCSSCTADKTSNYVLKSVVPGKKEINQNTQNREVIKFLGHRCLEIIADPEKAEIYKIDWTRQLKQTGSSIQGYPVVQKGQNLDTEQIQAVYKIISSSSSYDFKWSKRIRIRPSYALRFISSPEKVDIVIDFNTRQWVFYHDNKLMTEDITKPADADLQNIIFNLF